MAIGGDPSAKVIAALAQDVQILVGATRDQVAATLTAAFVNKRSEKMSAEQILAEFKATRDKLY